MILAFIEKIDLKPRSQENSLHEEKINPEPGNSSVSGDSEDQRLLLIREKIEKERFERELIARSA